GVRRGHRRTGTRLSGVRRAPATERRRGRSESTPGPRRADVPARRHLHEGRRGLDGARLGSPRAARGSHPHGAGGGTARPVEAGRNAWKVAPPSRRERPRTRGRSVSIEKRLRFAGRRLVPRTVTVAGTRSSDGSYRPAARSL